MVLHKNLKAWKMSNRETKYMSCLMKWTWICYSNIQFVCLFVLFAIDFNVSLAVFQSYCDGTRMRHVIVLPHWNAPIADTWQEHPIKPHYQLKPGRTAIFPGTHILMPSVSKGATSNFYEFWYVAAGDQTPTFRTASRHCTTKLCGLICRKFYIMPKSF